MADNLDDLAAAPTSPSQEQLYSERERHNSEIQALRQEISRLLSSQQLRRLDAALTDEFNNRDVLDKMLTQCIAERDQLRAQQCTVDRKSTRLNSSHRL